MIRTDDLPQLLGRPVQAQDGAQLGTVERAFVSDRTGAPRWAYVSPGRLSAIDGFFIPLADATFDGETLRVPYTEEVVLGAPVPEVQRGHLSEAEEDRLFRYYGLSEQLREEADTAGVVPDAQPAPAAVAPAADDAMTRSEEHLEVVGTERVETGRVRVRKYVVTEEVTVTVPVRREKVAFEVVTEGADLAADAGTRDELAAGAGDAGTAGAAVPARERERETTGERDGSLTATTTAGPDDEGWIVLHEERVSVTKEVVPVERVRLGVDRVEERQTISADLRKERIDLEADETVDIPRPER